MNSFIELWSTQKSARVESATGSMKRKIILHLPEGKQTPNVFQTPRIYSGSLVPGGSRNPRACQTPMGVATFISGGRSARPLRPTNGRRTNA
mmetsp:Transcript_33836/g.79747  ORF Transcript_33836/g.79747 Transcript_33836/m.79747 type:complete len:92 (+) Transcript_33836:306-581(+)